MGLESFVVALNELGALVAADTNIEPQVAAFWRARNQRAATPLLSQLPQAAQPLARSLAEGLAALTREEQSASFLAEHFAGAHGGLLLTLCAASAWRRDVRLAPLLEKAKGGPLSDYVAPVARARVTEGPLRDALRCAPLIGAGDDLLRADNNEAVARIEILIWEAGASALEVPEFGRWLWSDPSTFEVLVEHTAHGTLLGRVLAARCLEMSAGGMPETTSPELVGRTLQVLQPLLLHPEPLVWVHAARALGRLSGPLEQLTNTILDWVHGPSQVLRQRAVTAFASLPGHRLSFLASQLVGIIESRDEEAWGLAAVSAATPYLFFERRKLWDQLADRILSGDGGAIAARALARGLATLFRRGERREDIELILRQLREMSRGAGSGSLEEMRRWIEVTAVTDVVEGAERDPLDLELGIENLNRIAAQYDDAEADARAARFAAALLPTFQEARKIALTPGRMRSRAAAINALEGTARAFALRLWSPLLHTSPVEEPIEEPDLEDTWVVVAKAPSEMLDHVAEQRREEKRDEGAELALEVLAIRLGGYALDACRADSEGGRVAHDTCLWLRKVEGLADGSRELPKPLKSALSSLFWRLVDTTRGTALGEVDDVAWLGPFAAWWALVIDRPAMLLSLATALPLIAEGALDRCVSAAETLRSKVAEGAENGAWREDAAAALLSLHADKTELGEALLALAQALHEFASAAGPKKELEQMCLALVIAADRLQGALSNPVKALHPATAESAQDSLTRSMTENAPRVAALVARAIRARELSMLDVWLASLGPIGASLLETSLRAAIKRTPPPPPVKKKEPTVIEGYELIKPLGEGGIGTVWLVRKPGADRFFVLKIPKADALANATETEREGILESFVEEAKALAGLYHPNVANIIDRGVSQNVPFLVLEYLIGADLKQYATAKLMSLFELRQVVIDSCAGLSALHSAGLVHRDIKPANIWLRLPLAGGERFDPAKHRDPANTPPLNSVVIDFGMVRATRVAPEAGGRFVAGTAGYIAPEQVLDPIELDGRADIYALAASIYNVTTGRAFFDDIDSPRDRIIAHMRRDPFEDATRLTSFPASVARVMRAGTAMNAADRPLPVEFAKEFAAAL